MPEHSSGRPANKAPQALSRTISVAGLVVLSAVLASCGLSTTPAGSKAQVPGSSPATQLTHGTGAALESGRSTVPRRTQHTVTKPGGSAAPGTTSDPPGTHPSTTSPPTTLPPLGAPGPGLVAGHVTAIGDSVMIDQEPALQADIAGIDVEATVGFQWYQGVSLVSQLRTEGRLGSIVVIGLGTNGPISSADFDSMMAALSGVSRVVFINVHVDQPWQSQVNSTLAAGVLRYPKVAVLADWYSLAAANPSWFYSDGTHLPIGGPGAQALAALVASKVKG